MRRLRRLRSFAGASPAQMTCPASHLRQPDPLQQLVESRIAAQRFEHRWTIEAAATFRPWIFVRGAEHLTHEHEHIRDVERFTAQHVAGLEALSFPSGDACLQRSIQEASSFGETMRAFARRSNEERHPVLSGRVDRETLRRVVRGRGERP